MVRSLARVYYYLVFIAMLDLAAVGLGLFLSVMLRLTPLGDGNLPSGRDITQVTVFSVVAWVIAALLGGLHYWLIRRDLTADPGAGAGGVRSFFLNLTEFVGGWMFVGFGASALVQLGYRFAPSVDSPDSYPFNPYQSVTVIAFISIAVAALGVVVVLELERRRTQAGAGAPIVFQRLHFYLLQLVVLGYAAGALGAAISATITQILAGAGLYRPCGTLPPGVPFSLGPCADFSNLPGLWPAAVFTALAFVVYWRLPGRDATSTLRQVSQLLGLAYGAGTAAVGVGAALNLALRTILGEPFSWQAYVERSNFLPSLLVGLLVAGVYTLWLRRERESSRIGAQATELSIRAVIAFVFAAPFWFGLGWLLYRLIEITTNATYQADALGWSAPLATALTGAIYIPVALSLRRMTRSSNVQGPRRAFVLALLAGGTVTGAIGAAITLYSVLTSVLGVPVDSSGEATRVGATLLVTGAALAGLYGWSAVSEHLFGRRTGSQSSGEAPGSSPVSPTTAQGPSVETVLDELLSGQITRDEAAAQVRAAVRAGR